MTGKAPAMGTPPSDKESELLLPRYPRPSKPKVQGARIGQPVALVKLKPRGHVEEMSRHV